MCVPRINKARWPSGPRRATQEILVFSFPETWDVFASRKGRGFESHSCHFLTFFFLYLLSFKPYLRSIFIYLPWHGTGKFLYSVKARSFVGKPKIQGDIRSIIPY